MPALNDEKLDAASGLVKTELLLAIAGTILPPGEGKLVWITTSGAAE